MKRAYNLEAINRSWTNIGLPEDMSELSFLDVGCWCGGYVKIAEERGAKKAVGLDAVRSPDLYDIDFIHMDIFSEKFLEIERFDIVLSRGVLYHVENPISFLYRLKSSQTKISKFVFIKHLYASSIEQTIGSPLTLNEVLTTTGQAVISLKFFNNL